MAVSRDVGRAKALGRTQKKKVREFDSHSAFRPSGFAYVRTSFGSLRAISHSPINENGGLRILTVSRAVSQVDRCHAKTCWKSLF